MAQRRAVRWQSHLILIDHLAQRSGLAVIVRHATGRRRSLFDSRFVEDIVAIVVRQSFFGGVGVALRGEMLALADCRVGGLVVQSHGWAHVAARVDGDDFATRCDEQQLVWRSGGRAWRS
jgi:hypothetical protein